TPTGRSNPSSAPPTAPSSFRARWRAPDAPRASGLQQIPEVGERQAHLLQVELHAVVDFGRAPDARVVSVGAGEHNGVATVRIEGDLDRLAEAFGDLGLATGQVADLG